MYRGNGTYYTEEHSISFGDLKTTTSDGITYTEFDDLYNTWEDWHMIPSSRPSVAHPAPVTKFVEIPGSDSLIDLSTFLTGAIVYGQRQGSFAFVVDNFHEDWEAIRSKIVSALHGKKLKMRLMDDPNFYYEGYFTVGNWESGASNSAISIGYQLAPYKYRVQSEGTEPVIWDTFNFETDYDYYAAFGTDIQVSGTARTFKIYGNDFAFSPTATWVSGNVTVTFGGVTQTLSSSGTKTLGKASMGENTLTVSGTGSVKIEWRGGAI